MKAVNVMVFSLQDDDDEDESDDETMPYSTMIDLTDGVRCMVARWL